MILSVPRIASRTLNLISTLLLYVNGVLLLHFCMRSDVKYQMHNIVCESMISPRSDIRKCLIIICPLTF
jgi:hypothetical protein